MTGINYQAVCQKGDLQLSMHLQSNIMCVLNTAVDVHAAQNNEGNASMACEARRAQMLAWKT